jgi:hypothetical protein
MPDSSSATRPDPVRPAGGPPHPVNTGHPGTTQNGSPYGRAFLRESQPRTPVEVDSFRPSAARMYDYYLGGSNHLAADREAAEALLSAVPDIVQVARHNRDFLRRVVTHAISRGITQFLDLGAGFALAGGVADTALAANRESRVVSVDIDPGVVAQIQAEARSAGLSGHVGALHADLRDTSGILQDPVTGRLLDLDRPVAILGLAVLHFVPGDLRRVLAPLRKAAASGSLLAISHASSSQPDGAPPADPSCSAAREARSSSLDQTTVVRLIYDCTLTPLTLRTADDLRRLLTGLHLVGPGVVPVDQWWPPGSKSSAAAQSLVPTLLGAVAELP